MLRVCIREMLKPPVNVPISRTSCCSCLSGIRNLLVTKILHFQRPKCSESVPERSLVRARDPGLIECSDSAWEDSQSLAVIPGFVSAEEEQLLLQDISRSLRGKRYEFQHWDGVSWARSHSHSGLLYLILIPFQYIFALFPFLPTYCLI